MQKHFFLICLLSIIIYCSCQNNQPFVEINEKNINTEIYLQNLDLYRYSDANSNKLNNIEEINKIIHEKTFKEKNYTRVNTSIDYINLNKIFKDPIENKNVSYLLSTNILNEVNDDLFLLIGCSGNIKIWLDNQEIFADNNPLYKKFSKYLPLGKLNKQQKLIIKIEFSPDVQNHKITIALSKKEIAQKFHHRTFFNEFLSKSIIFSSDSLKFLTNFDVFDKMQIQIRNTQSIIFQNALSLKKKIPHLQAGIYTCLILSKNGDKYEQPFVVGNIDSIYDLFSNDLKKISSKAYYFKNIVAYDNRYQYLQKYPKNIGQRISKFIVSYTDKKNKWIHGQAVFSQSTTLGKGTYRINEYSSGVIKITGLGNTFNSWNALSEVKIWGKDSNTEQTSKELVIREIIANSFEGKQYPANAIDKNYATSWQSSKEGDWINFNLQKHFFIDSIQIAWNKDIGTNLTIAKYQKEKVSCIWKIYNIYQQVKKNDSTTPNIESIIQSYHSPVDSSRQEYLVQFPEKIKTIRNKLPLILHIPPRVQTPEILSRSYLMSSDEVKEMQYLTSQHNFIDVWAFGANYSGRLLPSGIKEYDAIIQQVSQDFNIDIERIYIMASCSGSMKAIQYASKTSIPIAAMSFCPAYYDPTGLTNSQQLMYNVKNIPINAINSTQDEITPIDGLNMLIDSLSKFPNKLSFKKLNNYGREFYVSEHQSKGLSFLFNYTSKKQTNNISFKTNNKEYGKKYWIDIANIKYDSEANISAYISNSQKITIQTKNINQLNINTKQLPNNIKYPISIFVNNQKYNINANNCSSTFILNNQKNDTSKHEAIVDFFTHQFDCIVLAQNSSIESYIKKSISDHYYNQYKRHIHFINASNFNPRNHRNILIVCEKKIEELPQRFLNKQYFDFKRDTYIVGRKEYKMESNAIAINYPLNTEIQVLLVDISNLNNFTEKIWSSIFENEYEFSIFYLNSDNVSIDCYGFIH